MTGYGRATAAIGNFSLTVVVSSVNRKTLDLTVGLPDEWESLEPAIGELVRRHATRGKVHVDIEVTGDKSATFAWDEVAATEALKRVKSFAAKRKVPFRPSADLLWQIVSAQKRGGEFPPADTAAPLVTATLAEALRAFAAMRAKEGEALLVDFLQRAETLHRQVEAIAARAPEVPAHYRGQLMRRLREAGLELDLDD
ncbi:MAG: YicC family protein, partial [Opitutaceae bacterium]|nr:YicC family protein [Opitutaceae bacterium]